MNRKERRAAKAAGAASEIRGVSAYWRSDTQAGVSVSVDFPPGPDGNAFAERCERMMLRFDQAGPERALVWLAKIGRELEPMTGRRATVVIATIHWLERRRHIVSDEYNGVVWIALQGGTVLAFRDDEPSAENWRRLRAIARDAPIVRRELDTSEYEEALREILHTPPSN